VIAALSGWHEQHDAAAGALDEVTALPGHVAIEANSLLTRLPGGLAVPAAAAANLLVKRFQGGTLQLADADRRSLLEALAAAGVFGGASYDGLVALEAAAHGRTVLTLDLRAQTTYRRLGVPFRVIGEAD
jgi:hypothetical protein